MQPTIKNVSEFAKAHGLARFWIGESKLKKLHMVITGLILAGLCLLTQFDYEDELLEHLRYCSMVEDYAASNGESGHPDYNRNYKEICNWRK